MKIKSSLVIVIFLLSLNILNAQIEDIIVNADLTSGELLILDNDLYYSYGETIAKYNLTTGYSQDIITLPVRPHGLERIGNYMYSNLNYGSTVVKFDYTITQPQYETVATISSNPLRLVLHNNYMYCNHGSPNDNFVRFDINDQVVENFGWPDGVSTNGFLLIDNVIYAALSSEKKIVKFDLNQEDPIIEEIFDLTDGLTYPHSLLKIGNYIYVSDLNSDRIYRFNYNETNPNLIAMFFGPPIAKPMAMEYKDNRLYVNLRDLNKIVSINLDFLGINNYNTIEKMYVSPNPISDLLTLQNVDQRLTAAIYDINGKLVLDLITFEPSHNTITLEDLKSGLYFLKILGKTKTQVIRFIKK